MIEYLTKFEKTRVLITRVTQLNNGSRPLVDAREKTVYEIAKEEYEQGLLTYNIVRRTPNGKIIKLSNKG